MSARDCIARLSQIAGRQLTDEEAGAIFERVHRAALDIKAGRVEPEDVGISTRGATKDVAKAAGAQGDALVRAAAERATRELLREADLMERRAYLQAVKLGARAGDAAKLETLGMKPLDAVRRLIARDYSGRTNVKSLEVRAMGYQAEYTRKLLATWDALGNDFLGFFQDRAKLLNLVRELRGEATGDALAAKGAKAFHDVAEDMRRVFNQAGGDIGRIDDWGMPQHHSQAKVAAFGKDGWVEAILPLLDRARYVDDLGQPWNEAMLRDFLNHAWDTIATDGYANIQPGSPVGRGARANRHGQHRQIHFKDAQSLINYWERFGERTAPEILVSHVEGMAKDIAFLETFGPNPNATYQTLRDSAIKRSVTANPVKLKEFEADAKHLDNLYNYAAGRTVSIHNANLVAVADGIANLNVAGKLGGAMIASLFGDRVMTEAVGHLNNLPVFQRWRNQVALLNPANRVERNLLRRNGLMAESIRSTLNRFYDGLGKSSPTGKVANAVMRLTGMQAINDLPRAGFMWTLMDALGGEIAQGKAFNQLADSDVRMLRNYGITEADWNIWRLAELEDFGKGNKHVLTPDAIARITDDQLKAANIIGQADGPGAGAAARREAIVTLLGAVNSEGQFAVVQPGWTERAQFFSNLNQERGTVLGEAARSVLQFKSFPWAYFKRGLDAVANRDGVVDKATMTAYLMVANAVAGALIMQTRGILAGKDPRTMLDRDEWYKFWLAAFLQGGALGIYGDFLYGVNETRYGTGPLEALAGPTLGPLLELGIVQPLNAAKKAVEGKPTHLAAQTIRDLKGFIPGNNIWYTKAATEHLIWMQVMDALSPGYLNAIRQRTMRDYHQEWWWRPGDLTPERAPDLSRMVAEQ